MFICQLGMHNNVQGHRSANVCKQTYDASCTCTVRCEDNVCVGVLALPKQFICHVHNDVHICLSFPCNFVHDCFTSVIVLLKPSLVG